MSAGRLALHDAIAAQAEQITQTNKSVKRGNVTAVNPVTVEVADFEHPLIEGEDFDLTQFMALYEDVESLKIGETVLMHQDENNWVLMDVVSNEDPPRALGVPPGGSAHQVLGKVSATDRDVQWIQGIPEGGTSGQMLAKVDSTIRNIRWQDPLPRGGETDRVLAKADGEDFATYWAKGVPSGGTTDQVLAKASDEARDTRWVNGIPSGGTTGQALTKADNSARNTRWSDPIPRGGTAGQVLTKRSATDFDAQWGDGRSGVSTALPANPRDGAEIYLQSAGMLGNGVMWHLRYTPATPGDYKWIFLGGAAWEASGGAPVNRQPSGSEVTWQALPATPTLILPRAGRYSCSIDAYLVGVQSFGGVGLFAGNDLTGSAYASLSPEAGAPIWLEGHLVNPHIELEARFPGTVLTLRQIAGGPGGEANIWAGIQVTPRMLA